MPNFGIHSIVCIASHFCACCLLRTADLDEVDCILVPVSKKLQFTLTFLFTKTFDDITF